MTGMILALFLYLLLKQLHPVDHGVYECHGCRGLVRFDGVRFVHQETGAVWAKSWPARYANPVDETSPAETHRAVPINYPLGRVA